MTTKTNPLQNHLLAALPVADRQVWLPRLEGVDLQLGQVLAEPGEAYKHMIFPTSAVVALLSVTGKGHAAEVAVAGCDGLVGMPVLTGGGSTTQRAVVQVAGQAYRIGADFVRQALQDSPSAMAVLLRYTVARMAQVCQAAVCNRHHAVDQQFCRWLLLNLDRMDSNTLQTTQYRIAEVLGVRREGVTGAAVKLQQAGVIRYTRGRITVVDRRGLEARSCECYAVVKKEFDRLIPA